MPPTNDWVFKLLFGDERNKSMLIDLLKSFVEQMGKHDPYEKIQRVICVCILSRALFPEAKEYLNRFRFHNRENDLCFDDIPEEIYTLELSKVPDTHDGARVWEWLQFLLARTQEEFEMIAERNPEIRKAKDALYTLSADPAVRGEYEMREKAWRDRVSQFHDAVTDAAAKGRAEERGIWQGVVADKDAENERLRAQIAELQAQANAFK